MSKLSKSGLRAFLAPLNWIIVTGIVFFLSSGQINNIRAWIYIAFYFCGSLIFSFVLLTKSPELLNSRGKVQEGTKILDKYLILTYFIFAIIVTPLIAGLDVRFDLFRIPFPYLYLAIGFYILSATFSLWPMLHNPFFEGTVRIQDDRMHKVIKSGPYKIVRHPGYIGMLLGSFPLPFAFGSALSFFPVFIMVIIVFVRTYFEDKTLQEELPGYFDYCREVKYRLIPFIW
jgi:protein-S-isoprenylcysteine O-methyltransferase Ste14